MLLQLLWVLVSVQSMPRGIVGKESPAGLFTTKTKTEPLKRGALWNYIQVPRREAS